MNESIRLQVNNETTTKTLRKAKNNQFCLTGYEK